MSTVQFNLLLDGGKVGRSFTPRQAGCKGPPYGDQTGTPGIVGTLGTLDTLATLVGNMVQFDGEKTET
jgi:hypothetical protein